VHPLLLDLGVWQVTSYGLALTLGFGLGIGMMWVRGPRHGLLAEPLLGVSIVIVVSSIVGSRLFLALTSPAASDETWLDALNPFASGTGIFGLSVMGGLPAATGCAWLYLRLRGLPVLAYMDLGAPSVAFGAGVTRIGCFLNGCCHGVVCDWPWAVRFPSGSLAHSALGDVAVHPTQLYQSLAGFAIGFGLLALARRELPAGSVVSAMICTMGLQRLAIEMFRHHAGGEIWFQLGGGVVSVYQGAALSLVVIGAAGWVASRKQLKHGQRS
jgi:phosphatidylglycerol:prolipoprotein diacylglycerol transferase